MGPLLFTMHINDIHDNIASHILKFADDTKIFSKVATQEEINHLQEDLNKLYHWSLEWQMLFNLDKCKCIHLGHGNNNKEFRLRGQEINSVDQEKNLRVLTCNTLSPSAHIAKVVSKDNQVMVSIRKTIEFKSKDNSISLYKFLEYCLE